MSLKLVVNNSKKEKPDWKKRMDERIYQKMLIQMKKVFEKVDSSSVASKE